MDIETKFWSYSDTGTKMHAFHEGKALCRPTITRPVGVIERTAVDYCTAQAHDSICSGCLKKFNAEIAKEEAFQARLAASMQPSTGEGDYLPPSENLHTPTEPTPCCAHASMYHGARGCDECYCTVARQSTKTHHYNAMGGQRYMKGVGWQNHCRTCDAPEGTGDHFHNPSPKTKENRMTYADGPLTKRQIAILDALANGVRPRDIAEQLKTNVGTIRQEAHNIRRKFKAETTAQAVGAWRESMAYRRVATKILAGKVQNPVDEAEVHVNHVMEGLAVIFDKRAEGMLPR